MKLLIWLPLAAVVGEWYLTIDQHPENVGLLITTQCYGADPFFAYNRADLGPLDVEGWMRRHAPQPGSVCSVTAQLLRNSTPDDPTAEFVAEGAFVQDR